MVMEKINRLWWISQPEAHSFYLLRSEYRKIQDWIAEAKHMEEEVMVYGIDILGEHHPTHAICRLYSHDTDHPLGDLTHPIFNDFPFLKDIRQELKQFTHE